MIPVFDYNVHVGERAKGLDRHPQREAAILTHEIPRILKIYGFHFKDMEYSPHNRLASVLFFAPKKGELHDAPARVTLALHEIGRGTANEHVVLHVDGELQEPLDGKRRVQGIWNTKLNAVGMELGEMLKGKGLLPPKEEKPRTSVPDGVRIHLRSGFGGHH